ncbi:Protein of unknown function [Gryllus bimaculatus]|nr:Protein of unknown function [Gryllus bimaculatus]
MSPDEFLFMLFLTSLLTLLFSLTGDMHFVSLKYVNHSCTKKVGTIADLVRDTKVLLISYATYLTRCLLQQVLQECQN